MGFDDVRLLMTLFGQVHARVCFRRASEAWRLPFLSPLLVAHLNIKNNHQLPLGII
jgi:hypothetical protein